MAIRPPKQYKGDKLGRAPLHYAAAASKADQVRDLLASGADVNAQDGAGWTPLHFAAQARSEEITRLLLAAGALPGLQDEHGNTALFRAVFASRGEGEVISLLRAAGADPFIQNKHGVSAVELARNIANYATAQHFADLEVAE